MDRGIRNHQIEFHQNIGSDHLVDLCHAPSSCQGALYSVVFLPAAQFVAGVTV